MTSDCRPRGQSRTAGYGSIGAGSTRSAHRIRNAERCCHCSAGYFCRLTSSFAAGARTYSDSLRSLLGLVVDWETVEIVADYVVRCFVDATDRHVSIPSLNSNLIHLLLGTAGIA